MKLLLPTIKFETKKITELDQFIIETNFSFPTQIVLQNWKHYLCRETEISFNNELI